MQTYHIYNRGVEKMNIFRDGYDYDYFLALLYLANSTDNHSIYRLTRFTEVKYNELYDVEIKENLVEVLEFCLMPNHFHFIISGKDENIGKFLQKLNTGYAMHFNSKYERTGSLYQGKPKKKTILDQYYLAHLFTYIAINPIELFHKEGKKNVDIALKHSEQLATYNYCSESRKSEKRNWIKKIIHEKARKDSLFTMDSLNEKQLIKLYFDKYASLEETQDSHS